MAYLTLVLVLLALLLSKTSAGKVVWIIAAATVIFPAVAEGGSDAVIGAFVALGVALWILSGSRA